MRKVAFGICSVLAVVGLTVVAPASDAVAPANSVLPLGVHFAPAPNGDVSPMATSPVTTAGSCQYRQNVDNPHVTRGEASVHGWWTVAGGHCPSTATVTVYLQAYGCDDFNGCEWYTVNDGKRDVKPGTSKRANARLACADTHTVGWRGYVDVNLDGVSDPANHTYTDKVNLACSP